LYNIFWQPDDPSLAATDPHLYNLKEVAVQVYCHMSYQLYHVYCVL